MWYILGFISNAYKRHVEKDDNKLRNYTYNLLLVVIKCFGLDSYYYCYLKLHLLLKIITA